jgi:hypothetical protein
MHRKRKFVRYDSKTKQYSIRDYREGSSHITMRLSDYEKEQANRHPNVWVMVK